MTNKIKNSYFENGWVCEMAITPQGNFNAAAKK